MNNETLNILLTDRTLGELSPEISELLDAYVSQSPGLAQQAQERQRLVAMLRSAVAMPAPKIVGWQLPRTPRAWFAPSEWARMAAVLAVGLSFGWAVAVLRQAKATSVGVAIAAPRSVAVMSPAPASAAEFWRLPLSDKRANARNEGRGYHLRWESPGKLPRVEGNR
jgi:hypothetical protein